MKKTHDLWINSYFSASGRSISMRLSTIRSSTFLHWQTQKKFAVSTIKIQIRIFAFNEIQVSKWLSKWLSYKRSCWEKGQCKLIKIVIILFPKDWSTFRSLIFRSKSVHFKRYSRPEHCAGHKCDKKRSNVHSPQSRKWLYYWGFIQFFGANVNQRTKWIWQALW